MGGRFQRAHTKCRGSSGSGACLGIFHFRDRCSVPLGRSRGLPGGIPARADVELVVARTLVSQSEATSAPPSCHARAPRQGTVDSPEDARSRRGLLPHRRPRAAQGSRGARPSRRRRPRGGLRQVRDPIPSHSRVSRRSRPRRRARRSARAATDPAMPTQHLPTWQRHRRSNRRSPFADPISPTPSQAHRGRGALPPKDSRRRRCVPAPPERRPVPSPPDARANEQNNRLPTDDDASLRATLRERSPPRTVPSANGPLSSLTSHPRPIRRSRGASTRRRSRPRVRRRRLRR